MRKLAWLVCLLTACAEPFDPFVGAKPFDPPAIYREWWQQVEECSGLTGDFDVVVWLESERMRSPGVQATADWSRMAVVMRPAVKLVADDVRHEMLHLLAKRPGHPPELFEQACGHLVWH